MSATPRQLESLIRISEGLAKMRLSGFVTVADVNEAVRLMRVSNPISHLSLGFGVCS